MTRKGQKHLSAFDDYKKRFYPKTWEKDIMESEDPFVFGSALAKKSLDKFKYVLRKE